MKFQQKRHFQKQVKKSQRSYPIALNKSLVLLFFVLLIPFPLLAEEKLKIAVLDFTASNLPDVYAATARDSIEVSLYKTGKIELLEKNRVELAMKEQNLSLDCKTDECAAKIGKLLSATHVITGSVTMIKSCTVTIRVVDVTQGKIVYADKEIVAKKENINTAIAALSKRTESKIETIYLSAKTESRKTSEYAFSASVGYAHPQGILSHLAKPGFCIGISAQYNKVYKDLYLGTTLSFISLQGKGTVSKVNIIPLTLDAGYNFILYRQLLLIPALSMGYALNRTTKDSKTTKALEPVFRFSISPSYSITEKIIVKISPEYSIFPEKSGPVRFFALDLLLQYKI
jgi:TolB-like protein